ncbi:MAG: hypothetical protein KC619_35860 [Myxococcales bacterium]|nr:hypothetical protein [Myxococcales bacterium]
MARPTPRLIDALRVTAARLEDPSTKYRWAHMGACNCGQLAQTITEIPREEIHRRALERAGDWGEQAVEHCAASGLPIDHILDAMLDVGLELGDVTRLERLSDRRVLARLPVEERRLSFRAREDVVRYMRAWADLLDEERAREVSGVRRVGAATAPASPSDHAASDRASSRRG